MNNTLLKGLAIIELLSRADRPLPLTRIAAELKIANSNVHRLMQALLETRYVVRDASGSYSASIRLWEIGSAVLAKLDLRRHAEAHMNDLLERTGESVHLSVLDRLEVVYVHKLESFEPVRAYSQIGGRSPAHCVATGKALLAWQSMAELERTSANLVSRTPATIIDPRRFMQEMRRVRARGYATNRGEFRQGVWGVAAPIVDEHGCALAAVGVSGPAERLRRYSLSDYGARVIDAARQISRAMRGGAVDEADARDLRTIFQGKVPIVKRVSSS